MKTYIEEEPIFEDRIKPAALNIKIEPDFNLDSDIKKTEESLKEMNLRFEKLKTMQNQQSPLISSSR